MEKNSSKSFSWKVGLSVPGRSIPWVGDGPHLYPRDRPNLLQKCPQNNQSRNMARLLSFSMQVSHICVIFSIISKLGTCLTEERDKKLVKLFKLLNAWKFDLLCLCLKRPSCPCLKLFLSLWSPKWVNFDSPQTFSKSQTCIKTSLAIIAILCKSRW